MNYLSKIIIVAIFALSSLCFGAEEAAMRTLFNGKDLTGWKGEGYVVENGAIVCTPAGRNLITEDTFANFILDFQFKLTPAANNGLGIHYPGDGDGAYTGMEIQILDSTHPNYKDLKDYQFHGGLYTMVAAKQGVLKPVGEWNQQRVTVMGPDLKVELNGQVILSANLDEQAALHPDHQGVKRRSGHIGWLGHGDRVEFKDINIKELPPHADDAVTKAAGFTQLIQGATLEGWKHTPKTTNWLAVNGVLKHNGKPGEINDLWTEKSYRDFTLICDWRWSGRGPRKSQPIVMPDGSQQGEQEIEELDSGIYLHGSTKGQVNLWNWSVGSGEIYGYRTDGNMSAELKASATPKKKADKPLGEWNRMKITLKRDRLSVVLNHETVIDNAQLPGLPETGPLGLQHHGSAIDFANIWIKEY